MKKIKKPKILVIVGPTASGKSDLAIYLAKKFNGEIINADSRQIYKNMDIGTGKVPKKEQKIVPHHLLDIISPKKEFSVAEYKKQAIKTIYQILKKKKLPIICGGTGFYIQAIVENLKFPNISPNKKLRKKLAKKTTEQLFKMLSELDPKRAKNIDKKNPRRLIRAIEIIIGSKKPIPKLKKKPLFNPLILGILKNKKNLAKLIKQRLKKRIKQGMIKEVKKLKENGLSWKRLYDFGLEYRYVSLYLRKILTKEEMFNQLFKAIKKYAKRQITWFKKYPSLDKKNNNIIWIKNKKEAEKIVKTFLKEI